jgi:hypothetical protein
MITYTTIPIVIAPASILTIVIGIGVARILMRITRIVVSRRRITWSGARPCSVGAFRRSVAAGSGARHRLGTGESQYRDDRQALNQNCGFAHRNPPNVIFLRQVNRYLLFHSTPL